MATYIIRERRNGEWVDVRTVEAASDAAAAMAHAETFVRDAGPRGPRVNNLRGHIWQALVTARHSDGNAATSVGEPYMVWPAD